MAEMTWRKAIEIVKPYVVTIDTPSVSGTGFLCAYTESKLLCGIATAAHVVNKSHLWEEPIRIQHFISGKTKLLHQSDRVIYRDLKLDTAVILFATDKIPFPESTLKIHSEKKYLKEGNEIGWVGFPSVSPNNLCFFTGRISCWIDDSRTYLVDGVAINGVSGGPVFYITKEGIEVIGAVSAYLPNRVGATPGLAMISHVQQFQRVIKAIKDFDEAKKKEISSSELKQEKNINT